MRKRVVVYCATGYGARVALSLDDEQYEVLAFADSNQECWGMQQGGTPIVSPKTILDLNPDYVVISRAEYTKEITDYLTKEIGLPPEKIEVYLPEGRLHYEEERIPVLRQCITMLKERKISGNLAEVGVYQGEFSKLFNRYFPERKLYLFDTFQGFASDRDDVKVEDRNNFRDTSVEVVLSKMVTPENCIVRKGYFPDTAEGIDDRFALVSLDCDLYEPILAGLHYFWPRLVLGGYIFVHDFGSYHYQGVKKAVYEFLQETHAGVVPVLDHCESVILAK